MDFGSVLLEKHIKTQDLMPMKQEDKSDNNLFQTMMQLLTEEGIMDSEMQSVTKLSSQEAMETEVQLKEEGHFLDQAKLYPLYEEDFLGRTEKEASSSAAIREMQEWSSLEAGYAEGLNEEKLLQLENLLGYMQQLMQSPNESGFKEGAQQLFRFFGSWAGKLEELATYFRHSQALKEDFPLQGKILEEMMQVYHKRSNFAKQQIYAIDAQMSLEDIERLLMQALEKHSLDHRLETPLAASSQEAMPMTQLQQYTLHVAESDRVDAINRQLVSQMAQILQKSQFLQRPSLQELTISLRPQHLGEMTIRFAQVDGELTVKLLVSSQLAKDLIETNLHQLKPLFAPHQIVVEREVTIPELEMQMEQEEDQEDSKKEDPKSRQQAEAEEEEERNAFETLLASLSEEGNKDA